MIGDQLAYSVSKGGINQLTRGMAVSLAEYGIRVNAIGPGTIATELARKAVLSNEEARRGVLQRTPLGRVGETSEVSGVAASLAGPLRRGAGAAGRYFRAGYPRAVRHDGDGRQRPGDRLGRAAVGCGRGA